MILIFASVILYIEMEDEKDHLEQNLVLKETKLDLAFTKKLFEMQNRYNKEIDNFIYNNKDIIEAFAKRDRKSLSNLVDVKFEKLMKENPNFSVICFGLPSMKSFYRAHMPARYGDDISKVYGVSEVTQHKKRVSGFSIAKLGLYYRVTTPVFNDGKYIGLIAFGISLGYVNDYIHEEFNTESAVLVKTKQLKRSKWYEMLEEGTIGRYTVIATTGELIEELKESGLNTSIDRFYTPKTDKTYRLVEKEILDTLNKPIAKIVLFHDITKFIKLYETYMYWFVAVLIMLVLILIYVLIKTFNKFLSTIVIINDDLKELNTNLEIKVEEEVAKNREKEYQMFEQAKMASLGEMIANIAHQWRQPLSVISTTASGLQVKKEFGTLKEEEIFTSLNQINDTTQYLSKTIDTFINFVKEKKELHPIVVQDRLDRVLNIISDTLKYHHIIVERNYTKEPVNLTIVGSELDQVIINIINNAKDILVDKKTEEPWIKIEVLQDNNFAKISIEDNGGGISKEILPKVFDPYFTTKHQKQGTGLGLHMSYRIVTESLNGKLFVKNSENGAKFFIEIPLA